MTAPYLSLRARQVLTFLKQKAGVKGFCWWKQERIARAMGCSLRTISGVITELVAAGKIQNTRRGHSNVYTILELAENVAYRGGIPVENVLEGLRSCVSDTQVSAYRPHLHPISEFRKGKEQLACLPEGNLCGMPLASIVPPTITNRHGRVCPNPEFRRIREILENAEPRIRRAANPEAYLRTILAHELGLAAGAGFGDGAQGDPATGASYNAAIVAGSRRPFEIPSPLPAGTSGTSDQEPKSLDRLATTTKGGGRGTGVSLEREETRRKPAARATCDEGTAEQPGTATNAPKGAAGGS